MSDAEVEQECKRFARAWDRKLLKASAHEKGRSFSASWDYRKPHPADYPDEATLRERYLDEMKGRGHEPSRAAWDWKAYAEVGR